MPTFHTPFLDRLNAPDANDLVNDEWGGTQTQKLTDENSRIVTITSTDSPYTVPSNVSTVLCDCTTANITLNLAAASGLGGKRYSFIKTDSSANTATIDANGAELINDATTVVLSGQYDNLNITSNTTKWLKIFSSPPSTGEANTAANVGTGTGLIFRDKIGVALNFKSIKNTDGFIVITNNADDVTLALGAHNHAATEITSATLDIARIPTGTSSTTVCIGNDSRLSDSRTPTAHKTSHESGGSDALTLNLDANARTGVRINTAGSTFKRRRLNLVAGSGMTISHADDSVDEEIDITFTASAAGTGSTTGMYNVHDGTPAAAGNGTSDDTTAINNVIGTTTYKMTTLKSDGQYRLEAPAQVQKDGAVFQGLNGRLKLTTSWASTDGDGVVSLGTPAATDTNGIDYADQVIRDLTINFNSQSGHPHGITNLWACKAGAQGTGADEDNRWKHLLITNIKFSGHSEQGKSVIYLRNLENRCHIEKIWAEGINSSSGTPTSGIKIEDIGTSGSSTANHGNISIETGHLSASGTNCSLIHIHANTFQLNRARISNFHLFATGNDPENNHKGIYLQVADGGGDMNNRAWDIHDLDVEDLRYGIYVDTTSGSGLWGFNVHDCQLETKLSATAAQGYSKGVTFEGAGEVGGHIHHTDFTSGRSGSQVDTGDYIGIDCTNLNVDTGHAGLIIDHCNFAYKSGSGTLTPFRGLHGQQNVFIHDCGGYNYKATSITNVWSGAAGNQNLYNVTATSSPQAFPANGKLYTNRQSRKRITISATSASNVTQIEINGDIIKQDSDGITNAKAGTWVLEPGETIKVTHSGSTNQTATVRLL